ncbi:MAG: polysaccharide biosynthesis protein PslH [Thermomicrobiales bacterium]|nr:polysaccharide biosynthesis protein PslH [Thermomicrobiales bacterium]
MSSVTSAGAFAQPSLLYVSPVVPSLAGNGLAMRAAHTLTVLSQVYRVSLLVTARYGSPAGWTLPPEIAQLCREAVVVPGATALQSTVALQDAPFDVVHVFRLGTIPYAEPYLDAAPAPERQLDLDDVESSSLRRIAALYRQHGDEAQAQAEEDAASAAQAAETDTLPRFDRIYVCSTGDVQRLPQSVQQRVNVLPNALPMPLPLPPAPTTEPAEILFVGTLGYFPNAEGVAWFATEVLPAIRSRIRRRIALRIVGPGASPLVTGLRTLPGIDLVGYVPDVRPWYAGSRVVVVPIRAGGGTRIKVLEAFALRRPVVATTIGAEGIDARDGEHLLLADDADEFAARFAQLIDEPGLGDRLAANAHTLFSARYTLEALARLVSAEPSPPPR